MTNPAAGSGCPLSTAPALSGVVRVRLDPDPRLPDYRAAMGLADVEARRRLGDDRPLS